MNKALWFAFGALSATVIITRIRHATESSCCERVSFGAADRLAGYTGPFSGLTKGFLEVTGLRKELPGLLDALGVAKDA
jgi:hypothetical protein